MAPFRDYLRRFGRGKCLASKLEQGAKKERTKDQSKNPQPLLQI